MQMPQGGIYVPVRLPADVKSWLKSKAERNCSSLSSEAVRLLRDAMDLEQQKAAG
jgi:hypothetical protein